MSAAIQPGEFPFAATHFDHGHIHGQTDGLLKAGGTLKWAWDADPKRLADFVGKFAATGVKAAPSFEAVLDDPAVLLVTSAAVPCDRGPIGCRVLRAGKDYFTDKSPFTTLGQLAEARRVVAETGRKYMVYYGERLHSESAWHAGELIEGGAIGKVLQVLNLGPHRLNKLHRPDWFFEKPKYGGILTDIGSHQFEQFLAYTGATSGRVLSARVANFTCPDKPGLEDFGEASLVLDTGASAYCRLDWLTPDGLRSWGDGRTFVLGDKGYLEIRKTLDFAREGGGDRIFLADGSKEREIDCKGKIGAPFFGKLVRDCLDRTETAMTQAHAFLAAELSMQAQAAADAANARG